ncbi:ATP-binding cassette domain-containing protein [Peribacillus simplex]
MNLVGLNSDNKTKVKDYSLGMKQKLGIAQAIMENQDILILDEPFNALDYKTYNDIKEIIRSLQDADRTILLTSHHFDDIEELCDEVYFIADGELNHLTEEVKSIYFKRS